MHHKKRSLCAAMKTQCSQKKNNKDIEYSSLSYIASLVGIHSICNNLHPLTAGFQSIPHPPALPSGNHKSVLYVCGDHSSYSSSSLKCSDPESEESWTRWLPMAFLIVKGSGSLLQWLNCYLTKYDPLNHRKSKRIPEKHLLLCHWLC